MPVLSDPFTLAISRIRLTTDAHVGDDYAFPPEIMDETEAILRNTTTNWTSNVFGGVGVGHGFAVRPGALGNDYHIYVIQKAAEDGISWFKAFL